jgi:hypothetical protein
MIIYHKDNLVQILNFLKKLTEVFCQYYPVFKELSQVTKKSPSFGFTIGEFSTISSPDRRRLII